jgi:hypothetical protein
VIAAGGKTVRGAKGKDGKAPYLVAALCKSAEFALISRNAGIDPRKTMNM